MDKPLKSITAYIGSAALSMTDILDVEEKDGLAFANIKLHDKKLDQDFLWRVQLEKDPNNKWTAVKIVNLKYMKKRKELLKNQVEFWQRFLFTIHSERLRISKRICVKGWHKT